MIQLFWHLDKPLTQNNYNNLIDTLNFYSLNCSSCDVLGDCTKHAYYKRNILTETGKIPFKILRVQCQHCNSTHALLPTAIVPYSQVTLDDQLEIINLFESGSTPHQIQPANPEIDTWIVIYIIKQYLAHWKQRLLAFSIPLTLSPHHLISSCFKHHQRQFMQIKRSPNALFQVPT
jgi:hypothetical protein